jgi:hypothetical protein
LPWVAQQLLIYWLPGCSSCQAQAVSVIAPRNT